MQASTAIANKASSTNSASHHSRTRATPVLEVVHTNDQNTSGASATNFFQPKLQVNQINDPYEAEADRVADEVTQSIYSDGEGFVPPAAPAGTGEGGALVQRLSFFQRKPAFESPTELDINSANGTEIQRSIADSAVNAPPVQQREDEISEAPGADLYRKTDLSGYMEGREVDHRFESRLSSSKGGGSGMDDQTRSQMESAFGADFSSVRIHTDSNAASLNNQVQAHAFTHGRDIYFNEGTYKPQSRTGTRLLAHELTHVVQQGGAQTGAVQRSARVQVSHQAPAMVQRGIISRARNWAADKANNLPGYAMLTVILGFNPINGANVPRNAANIFRAIMGFMPGGDLIWKALNNHGIFDQVGGWVMQKFEALRDIGSSIKSAFWEFVDSLGLSDFAPWNIGGLWGRAKRIFTVPIKKIISFIKGLVADIIKFIKDAILKPLASLAEGTRAWDLLIAVLGRNPITGDPVPRTADTLIGGFMKLIGQEEIWQNIKRGNAVARAWAWFQGAMGSLIALVSSIPSRFINALKSLKIIDIVVVPRAFAKIVGVFAGFAMDFASWAGNAMWELLKIIFVVVAPGAMPWLEKAGGALRSIFQNPASFLGNLVAAGKLGFEIFKENIGSILKEVLIDWLTGTLEGAGIYIPQGLTFPEILKFVLSVLGLTWENIRAKLVEHFGEGPVTVLEEGFELVQILVTEGPAAAWEKIQEQLSDLQETIIGEIITWVSKTVVAKAVIKIVSSLNPVGGFIQAILTIWGVIKVFIQRIRKIIQVGVAFMNSIMEIASGNIMPAAMKVVNTMKGILVLAVSFLAEFAGLGKIGEALQNILKKIRDPIDQAMDKMILWVKNKAKGFLKKKDDAEHKQIGSEIKQKLGEPPAKKDMPFSEFYNAKVTLAKALEVEYQGKLKDGVKLTISYGGLSEEEADKDIDVKILIAPNDYKSTIEIPHGGVDKDKIEEYSVEFNSPEGKFDETEYYDQLSAQKAGINAMTAKTFLDNRFAFLDRAKKHPKNIGRDPKSKKFQRDARKEEKIRRKNQYFKEIWPEFKTKGEAEVKVKKLKGEAADGYMKGIESKAWKKAEDMAKKSLKGQAALHDPDQVAGGKAEVESGRFGNAGINSSIGSQWRTRIVGLHEHAVGEFKTLSLNSRDKAKMNVEIPGTT